jgi:long-subunit fatty acid transport protein
MRPAVLAAALLLPAAAGAQGFHGNVALLGGRASGLGGAAVGLPEDDAAPFYNPAAVALDPGVQLSFSAQALQLQQRSYAPYLGSRATESSVALVPNASSGSFPWRGGRAAFAVFTTDDEGLVLNQAFSPAASTGVSTAHIRRLESSSTYQVGPSYGRPINEHLSVGFSLLYVYRTVSVRADEYAESADPTASPAAVSHQLDSDGVSQGLAFVGGIRVQPGGPEGRFTLGLSLRSGVSLSEQVVSHEDRFLGARQPDASLLFTRVATDQDTSARVGQPASAMLGGSARLGPGLISAQVTLTSAEPDLDPGVAGRLTVDGALGGEAAIDDGWSARAGLFSRRSSVQDATAAPRIDQYGGALGVGKLDPHHVTDVALVLIHESGEAPVTSVTGGTAQAQVSGYLLMITLGGAFRF